MLDKTEIKLHSVADIVGYKDIGVLLIHDKDSKRMLSIVVDNLIKEELLLRLSKKRVCKTMLPEVLVSILKVSTHANFEIIINDIVDGTYRAMIVDKDSMQPFSLRAADAVLLHQIMNIPMYATDQLLQRQALPINPDVPAMAMPYNALTKDMLQVAMDAAVKEEKYEVARIIRDELKKRGSL